MNDKKTSRPVFPFFAKKENHQDHPVLITGASGFVGGSLARRLHQQGYPLRCQYRRAIIPEHLRLLQTEGVSLIRAELGTFIPKKDAISSDGTGQSSKNAQEHQEIMASLVEGVHTVFHLAARVSDWGSAKLFERDNVEASAQLLKAAHAAGVKRFIAVSSLAVHGFGPHRESTEEGPYYPLIHPYQRTKKQAEERVLAYHSSPMAVSVIRSGNVYGPDDTTMMFPLLRAMTKGFMGTIDGGRSLTCPVYIDDLIDALLLTQMSPKAEGQVFNITGGEKVTWRAFLRTAAEDLGVKPSKITLPSRFALLLAQIMTFLWRLGRAKKAPPLTPYRVEQLAHDYHFSIVKAQKLLGYAPKIGYQEGLEKTVASFCAQREK